MNETSEKIRWATPPKYVGPACLVVVFVAALLAGIFIAKGMISEAMLVLVGAGVLLLAGIIDLLAELIMIGRDIKARLGKAQKG